MICLSLAGVPQHLMLTMRLTRSSIQKMLEILVIGTFLKDDKLDKILTDAREEADEKKRKALYRDAQEKLVELAPMVYIHHQEYLLGVDDSVKNFWIDFRRYLSPPKMFPLNR